ncbi:type II secretion system F family protein [Hyperthermus butylicus]|uniref:Conserved crenarchaeal protein n=1 Tax=Hyperthermus butylicus (strain DSM 5456 / JCM 9403 / PLM1-5) TaxID=415426 RepID=A2BLT2_HYPBU|nr:type II secretion system F family protein [Hyperthermus butylicus]ABM80943.1 conserved crenarchaeal protein [Hyperthermus butylicus DSM 5456]
MSLLRRFARRFRKKRESTARRRTVKKVPLTLIYDSLALTVLGKYPERFAKAFQLYEMIDKAGLNTHPTLYAARILFAVVLLLSAAVVATIYLAFLPISFTVKVVISLALFFAPVIVFVAGLMYPASKASSRAERVDMEFPFFAAYMTAMAYGGVPPEKLIERLAEIRMFRALREEARRILRDVKIFGKNILSALEHNALHHPSRLYRDFMLGYLTVIRTGGNVHHYLEVRTQEVIQARMEDLRNRADRVGLIVEAYVAVAVLGTLSFYIFFIVSGLIGRAVGGGLGGTTGLILYSFIVLPLITIAILMLLNTTIPSYENIREPYIYMAISVPTAFVTSLILLQLTGVYRIPTATVDIKAISMASAIFALGLMIASLGPAIVYMRIARKEKKINRSLPAFFRDLSEVRRTGLSPERSIIVLSERDYGELSNVIRRIAAALSMGLHVERAFRTAIKGYKSWILRVTMRFLVDAIDVGGGSPTTIDSLARFVSTLIELNENLKRRLKPFIIMPYFGAVIVAVASILTLAMLVNAIAATGLGTTQYSFGGLQVSLSPAQIGKLLLLASIASILNGWLSGLVAGKLADLHTAGGFLHATLLTAIVLVSIIAALTVSGSLLQSVAAG